MKKTLSTWTVVGILLASCSTVAPDRRATTSQDPARYSYVRLYCTPDTETRFETVTVELAKVDAAPPAQPFFAGGRGTATRVVLASFEPGWGAHDLKSRKFHPAPAAQWVVYLEGVMSITTSDNQTREFRPGDVLRVEDTSPCKGHISVVGDQRSASMIVR